METHEYQDSEAGRALGRRNLQAVSEGGVVVSRANHLGVVLDVLDAGTGMAPRFLTDAVKVYVYRPGVDAEDALTLSFATLADFLKALE